MYLVAVIDWHSRYVLVWQLSNTLDGAFCLSALRHALSKGRPTIFNTDQGAQFTADTFTTCLQAANIQVSMDGRGRALDNILESANAFGAASNMRTSISTSMTRCINCKTGWRTISSSTTMKDRIKVSTIAHRLNGITRTDQRRPQPSGRTLFPPFRGLAIGLTILILLCQIPHWGLRFRACLFCGKIHYA